MDQRESFERSSSESPAIAFGPVGGSDFGTSNGLQIGQTTIAPRPIASAYESSAVVDNVLRSDVCSNCLRKIG